MSDSRESSRRPEPVRDVVAAARAIEEFLRALGLDAAVNPELEGTGRRVAEAFAHEFCVGEGADFDALVRANLLPAPAQNAPNGRNVVWVRDVRLHIMCPHHLLPSSGVADVAYEPAGNLVGIGALAGLVELASRRLVLQEQLADDLATVLQRTLAPRWLAVRIELAHGCLEARGERAHGAKVETWTTRGDVPAYVASRAR